LDDVKEDVISSLRIVEPVSIDVQAARSSCKLKIRMLYFVVDYVPADLGVRVLMSSNAWPEWLWISTGDLRPGRVIP
jgi:hypothetical protein